MKKTSTIQLQFINPDNVNDVYGGSFVIHSWYYPQTMTDPEDSGIEIEFGADMPDWITDDMIEEMENNIAFNFDYYND